MSSYRDLITPNTPDELLLEETDRQMKIIVTSNVQQLVAWIEVIDAYGDDCRAELSDTAVMLASDHGRESSQDVEDFTLGDYLEGQIFDWRVLRDSQGVAIEYHLLVGFGGPNIWHEIDASGNCTIKAYWWGTRAEGHEQHELYARIFEYMEEVANC